MDKARVRFWQGFSLALGLGLLIVAGQSLPSVFAQANQRPRFAEIDVERINVVETDGTVKLVIANRARRIRSATDGLALVRRPTNPPASRSLTMPATRREG